VKFILTINQPMAIKLGMSHFNQAVVFEYISHSNTAWADTVLIDEEIYHWVQRDKTVADLPFFKLSPDTVYRHYKALDKLGLIKYRKHGNKDCIHVTPKGQSYYVSLAESSANIPNKNSNVELGNKSEFEVVPVDNTPENVADNSGSPLELGNKSEFDLLLVDNPQITDTFNANSDLNPEVVGFNPEIARIYFRHIKLLNINLLNNYITPRARLVLSVPVDNVLFADELILLCPTDADAALWKSFIQIRQKKKGKMTVEAMLHTLEALAVCTDKGVTKDEILTLCINKKWKEINYQWYKDATSGVRYIKPTGEVVKPLNERVASKPKAQKTSKNTAAIRAKALESLSPYLRRRTAR
jgi:DNA-binding transcriptional ArsR family regulator